MVNPAYTAARPSRNAFSLPELCLVLLGVAVVCAIFWEPSTRHQSRSQRIRAWIDLESLRRGVDMYEVREGKKIPDYGLSVLEGAYLRELPKDPWGNAYLYDAHLRLLASFGKDGQPGGTGPNQDLVVSREAQQKNGLSSEKEKAVSLERLARSAWIRKKRRSRTP